MLIHAQNNIAASRNSFFIEVATFRKSASKSESLAQAECVQKDELTWHMAQSIPSVLEMADPRKDHRDFIFIRGRDYFFIAHGSARLDDCRDAVL